MIRPSDEELVAFLEGRLDEAGRTRILGCLEEDPRLARELRSAAVGLAAVEVPGMPGAPGREPVVQQWRRPGVSPWWIAAAAAVTLLISVPASLWLLSPPGSGPGAAGTNAAVPAPEPGFVLVLQGRWPDAGEIGAVETRRRAEEYWAWADSLADATMLMAAGDLRWEPGSRLGPGGTVVSVSNDVVRSPDFLVGMFAIRAKTYEEAVAIARRCPHLRYGGSVSVRRSARGFLTTRGLQAKGASAPRISGAEEMRDLLSRIAAR